MLLATACAILVLVLLAATTFYLVSYRPTRVPVVEQAVAPQDMRAKVNTDARMRLRLHRHRRAGQSGPPITPEVAPVHAPVSSPAGPPVRAAVSSLMDSPARSAPAEARSPAFFQRPAAHTLAGAGPPGSYFRITQAPMQEAITTDVRGPWAAEIVTRDGRITLPDSGANVAMSWAGTD